ncbi:hypothetical protein [Thiobaca trueperi]|uniref:Pectate lyase n=1 Tax=Thiobaca trueperi TaxID=127458 RepID=A0A4R3N4F3_9GAMM|nr:hypothetical protein [Thiobaca trueperi]TCT23121.1 pectate lyase [Thiobaca trueperi]
MTRHHSFIGLSAIRRGVIVVVASLFSSMAFHTYAAVPAFPGAEGYGAGAIGGRGGKVLFVSNLNDAGPGSLREALTLDGPRIIVFEVGGTITLQSPIVINKPFVTIAGQSAPGGGITLRMADTANGPAINIATHDIVVRFIRVRRGKPNKVECCDDSISISNETEKVHNVIIDHCSISWATDELFDVWYQAENITIQWSMLSEGLADLSSGAPWGKGPILGDQPTNISVHHNFFANNIQRNPEINLLAPDAANFELSNNIIYNWAHGAIGFQGGQANTQIRINIIGNLFIPGPNYVDNRYEIMISEKNISAASVFVKDNIGPRRKSADEPDWNSVGILSDGQSYMKTPAPETFKKTERWSGSQHPISEIPSATLADQMLTKVGAVFPYRDDVDNRIINQLKNNTGKIIADPKDVGGWPNLPAGKPPTDTDRDGMPDEWEKAYGTDPTVNDSALEKSNNGYTNIEEYLNDLVKDYYIMAKNKMIPEPSARLREK